MNRSRNVLSAIGFAIAVMMMGPSCVVSGTGAMRVSGTTSAVVYTEPPQDQIEEVTVRPGHVWVRGRWDWRNGQWMWVGGRWERERAGYGWEAGRWERRGNQWHWIEGRWVEGGGSVVVDAGHAPGGVVVTETHTETRHETHHDGRPREHGHGRGHGGATVVVDTRNAPGGVVVTSGTNPMYPTSAPPAVRVENYGAARSGYVWVAGRWDWRNGQWTWLDGRWERERAGHVWTPGRWELQGSYYVWIDGRWSSSGPGVRVRDHRN